MAEDNEDFYVPPITSMEQFQDRIREWVVLDNQINRYNKKLKTLRTNRNLIAKRTTGFMEANNQENLVINIADGKLKYFETRTRGVPTITFIRNGLMEYFNNDETKVKEIVAFLQQRLPEKEDKGIKRYITKQNAGADGEGES